MSLFFAGQKEATEATKAALEVLPEPFRSMSQQMLKMCAYAGTGNVLIVQQQLQICSEHYTPVVSYSFFVFSVAQFFLQFVSDKASYKNVEINLNYLLVILFTLYLEIPLCKLITLCFV